MSAQLEEEKRECESQLNLVDQGLADDPQNAELLALRAELEQMLELLNESIVELQQAAAPAPAPAAPQSKKPASAAAAEEQPKWDRENHPAFKKAAAAEPAPEEPAQQQQDVVYQVNDNVLARWMAGDKGFYPARITSVTGSKTAPIYTVRFKSYDTVETVRGKDIKPVPGGAAAAAEVVGQKRKADGIVLSAGQELYPHAVEQKKLDAEKKGDKYDDQGRPKFKKIKAKKELEAGKNKWQEFTAKGKGKVAKKESMFRTPEGPGGRVGFTGSGQAMRKDPTRSRHVYQPNEDVD
ncbi:splicing factor spf30 [Podospora conica]|nr:splicing factor spf30 [Schizothecium conicum]